MPMFRSRVHPCGLVCIFEFEEGVCDGETMLGAEGQQESSVRVLLSNAMMTNDSRSSSMISTNSCIEIA